MSKRKIDAGNIALFAVIALLVFFILEGLWFAMDKDCICSFGFPSTIGSKIIGWILLVLSFILFIMSLIQKGKFSKWGKIASLVLFGIAFYGNGYMINGLMGGCGYSLNRTTFFVVQTKLGDFATDWVPITTENLNAGEFDGKLLGYSVSGKNLTLYRIGKKPLKVKTSFLFWKVRPNIVIHRLSPELHSYRNLEYEKNNDGYEFIGGQDMPIEVFLNEFVIDHKDFTGKELKNQRIINETDGTTRFRFEVVVTE